MEKRIIYYLQKVSEYLDMPRSKQGHRFPRLMKYKQLMYEELEKNKQKGNKQWHS